MRARMLVLAAVALLAGGAAGCSAGSKATTVSVEVDGKVSGLPASFNAYFPSAITAHPGDTIHFHSTFTGAPHTVTLGSAVDTALKAADTQGANAPELKAIPTFFPATGGDPVPVAADQCATSSAPPTTGACPSKSIPEFTRDLAYVNSGWLDNDATFDLKLAKSIPAGSYRYFCLIHRLNMQGSITVVDKKAKLPSAADVLKKGDSERAALASGLKAAVSAAQPPAGSTAVAGVGSPAIRNANADVFAPPEISVPAGTPITWTVRGRHTISFNAPGDAHLLLKRTGGVVKANTAAGAPAGGAAPAPGATAVDGGSWDGTGYRSSGAISAQAGPVTFTLTITKPGSYRYECLIHPGMTGTVKVS